MLIFRLFCSHDEDLLPIRLLFYLSEVIQILTLVHDNDDHFERTLLAPSLSKVCFDTADWDSLCLCRPGPTPISVRMWTGHTNKYQKSKQCQGNYCH